MLEVTLRCSLCGYAYTGILPNKKDDIKMRQLNLVLSNTKVKVDNWSVSVNQKEIGEQLANLLEKGEFIGTITITINQTGEVKNTEELEELF